MTVDFCKMHGAGNDYIVLRSETVYPFLSPNIVKSLCMRRYGIGSDGVLCVGRGDKSDVTMKMYNSDGSVGSMCGNGIRCAAMYAYTNKITVKRDMTVQTDSGIKRVFILNSDEITVDMGKYVFMRDEKNKTFISMGNLHAVCFDDESAYTHDKEINEEYVKINERNVFDVRVWERGCGETYSCGTGACAVAACAVMRGYADTDTDISIYFKGGLLKVRVTDEKDVFLTGNAEIVFYGRIGI